MDWRRIARHLFYLREKLPAGALEAIEQAVAQSEAQHRGEVRFAAEFALASGPLFAGQSARERAIEVFSLLRVWDTEENNGVLIYLLLADRDIEIVADRGISAHVPQEEWERICRAMERALARGAFQEAIIQGIAQVTELLARHFPARQPGRRNELADRAVVL